jgi:hypothetical protein
MKQTKTFITLPLGEGHSPKTILPTTKVICNWNGRYYRGVETEDFIYFCNYREGDDNGNVMMYRKSDFSLVSDNYHASNDLVGVLDEGKYTWISKTVKNEIKLRQEAEANM